MNDADFMRGAVALARRGLGQTAPNPAVGCVIVQQNRVVGRGVTAAGGRPHAEVNALAMAGDAARGATAYVTLEPCSFIGKSGACTQALISAGIARVVVGTRDPHPSVDGAGIAQLREAGIDVVEDVLPAACASLIAGMRCVHVHHRPLVRLKLASSLDGRIATVTGESKWITGEDARREVQMLRARHDAVMVGIGTVLADDPELTCRIEGLRATPLVRVVLDRQLRTPLTSRLVAGVAQHPLWILHGLEAGCQRHEALARAGVKLIEVPAAATGLDLQAALAALATHGLTRVLVEGGAHLAAGLLRADLVDRLAWFHAPGVIGGDGLPATQALGVETLADMPRFIPVSSLQWGADRLSCFTRASQI